MNIERMKVITDKAIGFVQPNLHEPGLWRAIVTQAIMVAGGSTQLDAVYENNHHNTAREAFEDLMDELENLE